MRLMHRYRRFLSVVSLLTFLLAGTVTPAGAYYDPKTGRFLQADPNGTGVLLQPALPYHAANPTVTVSMAYELQFGDGMNFYEYIRSNPVNRHDPSGLSSSDFDWFSAADSFESDWIGHRLYALGSINEGARWASLGLQTTLDVASGLLGIDLLQSVVVVASGQGAFWDSMNIFLAVAPFGPLVKAGGKLAKAFQYARKGSRACDVAASAAKHLFKILPYNQAQKLTKGWRGDISAHHILEARHLRKWGRAGEIPNSPAVILTRQQHQMITHELRTSLPYRARKYEEHEVRAVYREVYTKFGFGDWLGHIEKYFK